MTIYINQLNGLPVINNDYSIFFVKVGIDFQMLSFCIFIIQVKIFCFLFLSA